MYLLRRTAARAITAPLTAHFAKPRSIVTITSATFRPSRQQWITPSFQKRFFSDDDAQSGTSVGSGQAATQASVSFAQTATEAPVIEDLTAAPPSSGLEALETTAASESNSHESTSLSGRDTHTPSKVVYVGNLFYEVTDEQLKRFFSRYGEIEATKIVYDNKGLSRGFGYVNFSNVSDAQAAVKALDMQLFEGRNLVVQFHRAKPNTRTRGPFRDFEEHPPSKTLFIGNMSFEMSDKDLNDLFRDIRNVLDVRVAIDRRTGQPRGFAHADFIDVASAMRARETLQDKTIYGRQLRVDYSKSVPKKRTDATE